MHLAASVGKWKFVDTLISFPETGSSLVLEGSVGLLYKAVSTECDKEGARNDVVNKLIDIFGKKAPPERLVKSGHRECGATNGVLIVSRAIGSFLRVGKHVFTT